MKVFLSLCLLFSLVSPAVLLTCTVCENKEGSECTKNHTEECRHSEPSCASTVINGDLFSFLPRASYLCGYCEEGYYAFNTGSRGSFNMVCCGSDNCNAIPLRIPSGINEFNGRECSGCYSGYQEECLGKEVVRCLGDQTKCMKLTIRMMDMGSRRNYRTISARGCATPELCENSYVLNHMKTGPYTMFPTLECGDAV